MSDDPARNSSKSAAPDRAQRLKSALKANLARRKAQARARNADAASETGPADTDNKDPS